MRAGAAGPPTPELMAAIEALPPVRDWPHEDLASSTAPVVGPVQVLGFLRPFLPQLASGMSSCVDSAASSGP